MGLESYIELRTKVFFTKISKRVTKKGCLLWKGGLNKKGYGQQFAWINNQKLLPHRISYLLHYGDFDSKLCVCHRCDNPPCVNPQHLFLATHAQNMNDMKIKGRARKC